MIFSPKSDDSNTLLLNFIFFKMCNFSFYFIDYLVVTKTIFTKSYNFARVISLIYIFTKADISEIRMVFWTQVKFTLPAKLTCISNLCVVFL